VQFDLRPKLHGLRRGPAVHFGFRPKTHGLHGCEPCLRRSRYCVAAGGRVNDCQGGVVVGDASDRGLGCCWGAVADIAFGRGGYLDCAAPISDS